jgi:outer membrane protein TolC
VDWLKTFLLSNVASGNARTLGNGDDEVQLLANRYAQGAALAGDIDLAQGALDILAAEQVDPQLQEMVASRALASQVSLPEEVIAGIVPVTPNAMEILRERAEFGPGTIDFQILDQRVQDLMLQQPINRQQGP